MGKMAGSSVHLLVTSPPYFNAPFDYRNLYQSYAEYLELLCQVAQEAYRVLRNGRSVALNIDAIWAKVGMWSARIATVYQWIPRGFLAEYACS